MRRRALRQRRRHTVVAEVERVEVGARRQPVHRRRPVTSPTTCHHVRRVQVEREERARRRHAVIQQCERRC